MRVPTSRVVVGPLLGGRPGQTNYNTRCLHLLPQAGAGITHCGCKPVGKRCLGKQRWRRPRLGDESRPLCESCRQVEESIQHHDREVARAMAKTGFS